MKQEIYNEMCRVGRLKRNAENSKENYVSLISKVNKFLDSLKKTKENLNWALSSLSSGGFLIDSKSVDNGKINEINDNINVLVNNTTRALTEVNSKIRDLNSKIYALSSQYRDLEDQYRNAQ